VPNFYDDCELLTNLKNTFYEFGVSNGSETRLLRNDEKYYIYFIENLLLFPMFRDLEFSKSVNS